MFPIDNCHSRHGYCCMSRGGIDALAEDLNSELSILSLRDSKTLLISMHPGGLHYPRRSSPQKGRPLQAMRTPILNVRGA